MLGEIEVPTRIIDLSVETARRIIGLHDDTEYAYFAFIFLLDGLEGLLLPYIRLSRNTAITNKQDWDEEASYIVGASWFEVNSNFKTQDVGKLWHCVRERIWPCWRNPPERGKPFRDVGIGPCQDEGMRESKGTYVANWTKGSDFATSSSH